MSHNKLYKKLDDVRESSLQIIHEDLGEYVMCAWLLFHREGWRVGGLNYGILD